MFNVVANRILWACLMMAAISVVAFTLIQLPPGDFVDSYVNHKQQGGVVMTLDEVAEMRRTLGLDRPMYVQYFDWDRRRRARAISASPGNTGARFPKLSANDCR